jgi:acetamidase/formamidase
MKVHTVESTSGTVRSGFLGPSAPPVAVIDPGDVVSYPGETYALCSMAMSFRVTQYAHQTGSAYSSTPPKAVHGMVPRGIFPARLQPRVGAWLRPGHEGPK